MKKVLSMWETNLLFIALCTLLLTVGAMAQQNDVISGLVITEFGILLALPLLYLKLRGVRIRDTLRLRPVKPVTLVKVVIISILLIPVVLFLNMIMMTLIQIFGRVVTPDIPTATDTPSLLLLVFVIGVSAGICEEAVFRGILLSTYERELGRKWAAILTALLFGVFHFNLGNLFGPIFLGLVYSYYVQLTGSIIPAMLGHFLNNGLAVLMSFAASRAGQEALEQLEGVGADTLSPVMYHQALLVLLFPAFVGGLAAFFLLRSMKTQYPRRHSDLYDDAIDDRLDYTTTNYKLWGKQPARFGTALILPVFLVLVAFVFLTYRIFFAGL